MLEDSSRNYHFRRLIIEEKYQILDSALILNDYLFNRFFLMLHHLLGASVTFKWLRNRHIFTRRIRILSTE